MARSLPTDFLPNPLVTDYEDALSWWLTNPLLRCYYPGKMAALAKAWPTLHYEERRTQLLRLHMKRAELRADSTKDPGLHLPVLSVFELEWLVYLIPEASDRSAVFRVAQTLHPCERPWLYARLENALRARGIAIPLVPEPEEEEA